MKRRRQKRPQRRAWQPLQRASVTRDQYEQFDVPVPDRCYVNDLYSVFVHELPHDVLHISFHRHNRAPVRDWRHFQQIKNEVAGPERVAVEVFPAESELVDAANEYHLFVWPRDVEFPFRLLASGQERQVATHADGVREYGKTRARQRDWQPGLTTGLGDGGAS
jgi:hypothetical protein